jgi:hypothetical protein
MGGLTGGRGHRINPQGAKGPPRGSAAERGQKVHDSLRESRGQSLPVGWSPLELSEKLFCVVGIFEKISL